MTVSSTVHAKPPISDSIFAAKIFEIEFNEPEYESAINEKDKFVEHLCVYVASVIETKLIRGIEKNHKKECSQCIEKMN